MSQPDELRQQRGDEKKKESPPLTTKQRLLLLDEHCTLVIDTFGQKDGTGTALMTCKRSPCILHCTDCFT